MCHRGFSSFVLGANWFGVVKDIVGLVSLTPGTPYLTRINVGTETETHMPKI